jgi:5'-phosphate synthase pdxT subunit
LNDNLKIGILSVQGDIEENFNAAKEALKQLDITGEIINVKEYNEMQNIDGLIIPGGESTVISTLISLKHSIWDLLKNKINERLPVKGTCAG